MPSRKHLSRCYRRHRDCRRRRRRGCCGTLNLRRAGILSRDNADNDQRAIAR